MLKLGLKNPQETAKTEYDNSILITAKLTDQKISISNTTIQTSNIPETWKAEYNKRKQNAEVVIMHYLRNWLLSHNL